MIKEALDAYAKTQDKVWAHDRSKTVGASEIGLCARKTYWVKFGGQRDEGHVDGWGARMRGNVMEEKFWYPALKLKFGEDLMRAGPDQMTLQDEYLSATPDGLVKNLKPDALRSVGIKDIGDQAILVECKSIDPRVNLREAKAENEFQVQVQLGLIREQTDFRPQYALISYTDASFWNEVTEYAIQFDPRTFAEAKERAKQIIKATRPDDLKPEGWIAGGKECEYCPFTKACGIIRRSVPEAEAAADPQFVAEITDMVRELQGLQGDAETAASVVREKQQGIKDRLREKGVRKIPKVVTWSPVKGRRNYDNKGIQAAAIEKGIDIEAFSSTGEPTDMLTITLNNTSSAIPAEVAPAAAGSGKRKR